MAKRNNDTQFRAAGAYETPHKTVFYMTEKLSDNISQFDNGLIIDPASGDGLFLKYLRLKKSKYDLLGLEIDKERIPIKRNENDLTIINKDFIEYFNEYQTLLACPHNMYQS